jgi:2-hydroxychromene-2-carboxylate isomerase
MPDERKQIRFFTDPRCPWAWQTSKWMRNLVEVRAIDVEWRLFALGLTTDKGPAVLFDPSTRGVHAMRTMALVKRDLGNDALGALYEALGARGHDKGEGLEQPVVRAALGDAGLDEGAAERAWADDKTVDVIRADHDEATSSVRAFGVPTIVLPSGRGIFGPVISTPPEGEEAGELWDRMEWLAEKGYFFELKRERDLKPGEIPAPALF